MTLNDIEFDEPDPKDFPPHDYCEREEGKRTHIRSVWVSSYIYNSHDSVEYAAHIISLTNYGSATIDGKSIKDVKEIEWVKKFFNELEIRK